MNEIVTRFRTQIERGRAVYPTYDNGSDAFFVRDVVALLDAYETGGRTGELARTIPTQPAPAESDEELEFVKDAEEQTEEK